MRAFDRGKEKYPWWPDWRGECAAIVASGPSIKTTNVDLLKDRIHVLAIKATWEKCKWAEVVYGCDAPWWIHKRGLPEFGGVKLTHGAAATAQFKDLHKVEIKLPKDAMLIDDPLVIGNGGNSGFQALNLAIQFGATSIVLIGMDLHDRGGVHWYGRNTAPGMSNPMSTNFKRWQKGFDQVVDPIKKMGVEVVNACPGSDLRGFQISSLEEVMERWGL